MTVKQFKEKIRSKGFNELLEAYVFICDKNTYTDRQYALELIIQRLKGYSEWSVSTECFLEFTYNKLDFLK